MIRLAIFSATVAVLVALWLDRPKPIKSVQVDYCWIDYLAAGKDQLGNWHKVWASGSGVLCLVAIILFGPVRLAHSRDLGQWDKSDPITQWYEGLKQPDIPTASCCSFADAYYADEIHVRDGKTFAVVTDDRPDEPLGRPHVQVGTEFEIPNHKLKWDSGNPTGHNVLFMSSTGFVYCFVQGTGI